MVRELLLGELFVKMCCKHGRGTAGFASRGKTDSVCEVSAGARESCLLLLLNGSFPRRDSSLEDEHNITTQNAAPLGSPLSSRISSYSAISLDDVLSENVPATCSENEAPENRVHFLPPKICPRTTSPLQQIMC